MVHANPHLACIIFAKILQKKDTGCIIIKPHQHVPILVEFSAFLVHANPHLACIIFRQNTTKKDTCANLAQNKLHITDIQIHWSELSDALYKAGHSDAFRHVTNNGLADVKITYNARDIINLQNTFGL